MKTRRPLRLLRRALLVGVLPLAAACAQPAEPLGGGLLASGASGASGVASGVVLAGPPGAIAGEQARRDSALGVNRALNLPLLSASRTRTIDRTSTTTGRVRDHSFVTTRSIQIYR